MLTVKIIPNDKGNPPGKLADAELHFMGSGRPFDPAAPPADEILSGMKLIGFGLWERRGSAERNVTFPARQYSINGERRAFALLRPVATSPDAMQGIRDLILAAYATHEAGETDTPPAAAASATTTSGPDDLQF